MKANQSTAPRGCAECGESVNHRTTCPRYFATDNSLSRPVLDSERVAAEAVSEYIGVRCRLCKRDPNEINGCLRRVNEKGVPGIWECRPYCNTNISREDAIMLAITGGED